MIKFTAVKDERGITYTAPLPHPVQAGFYESREATHVMVWFNRTTRDWVVSYSSTDFGVQVGMSTYVYSRPEADETAARLLSVATEAKPHARVDEWDY